MKLTFHGAAQIVTGSCYQIETEKSNILVDCGMFQGKKEITRMNYEPLKFDPKKISHIILTHAHIDHSGLIPKVVNEGFKGKIVCTHATKDISKYLLEDSGALHEMEEKWKNKRLARQGLPLRNPLYTKLDATKSMRFFKGVDYGKRIRITDDIEIVFRDAGHILGSAIIEMFVRDGGEDKKIVFSGDLGQWDKPIIKDPEVIEEADYVLIESTYGDRLHEDVDERKELFFNVVMDTYKRNGKLIIPSFAMERTQEIIYYLNEFVERGMMPRIPVFIDSPLAINLTEVFKKHVECLDDETKELINSNDDPFTFPGLKYIRTAEESIKLNDYKGQCIIIAGSGMANGGRIKHHLKHNLWRKESSVLFVGYQAEGTLGRLIKDGAPFVRIFDEDIKVMAKIFSIDGFSAHADQKDLLRWAGHFSHRGKPKKFFIVHGEKKAEQALSEKLKKTYKYNCLIPKINDYVLL